MASTSLAALLLVVLAAPAAPARSAAARAATASASASAAAGDAAALTDAEVRARVERYLGAIDTRVTSAQWRALGDRAVPALAEAVDDSGARPSRRAAAVGALGAIGGTQAKAIVTRVAQDDAQPFPVRSAALRSAPGLLDAATLAKTVLPVVKGARTAAVRAVAAEVAARAAPDTSCSAVRAQSARETARDRVRFERALAHCTGR